MATARKFNAQLVADDMTLRGWLPVDLARHADVADMTVYRFLKGQSQTARTAKKLAEALGQTVERYMLRPRPRRRRGVKPSREAVA